MADNALQQVYGGEEYSVTQVACIEDSKNDATVGILSVIFEH
jgi:hypothetical protein